GGGGSHPVVRHRRPVSPQERARRPAAVRPTRGAPHGPASRSADPPLVVRAGSGRRPRRPRRVWPRRRSWQRGRGAGSMDVRDGQVVGRSRWHVAGLQPRHWADRRKDGGQPDMAAAQRGDGGLVRGREDSPSRYGWPLVERCDADGDSVHNQACPGAGEDGPEECVGVRGQHVQQFTAMPIDDHDAWRLIRGCPLRRAARMSLRSRRTGGDPSPTAAGVAADRRGAAVSRRCRGRGAG
ncbi:MAG: hypothetical protein QOJ32_556, partial [Frankiaceae bacterium]|nr:hypothetical protein [Frankiaceae bacterium]